MRTLIQILTAVLVSLLFIPTSLAYVCPLGGSEKLDPNTWYFEGSKAPVANLKNSGAFVLAEFQQHRIVCSYQNRVKISRPTNFVEDAWCPINNSEYVCGPLATRPPYSCPMAQPREQCRFT